MSKRSPWPTVFELWLSIAAAFSALVIGSLSYQAIEAMFIAHRDQIVDRLIEIARGYQGKRP